MKNKVFDTIKKHNLIIGNSSVCIACSGGADSVALLHFLYENKLKLKINELFVCHLNHCLRDEESERDMNFVKDLAESLGLTFFLKRVDVNELCKREHYSTELGARVARYEFFADVHKKTNALIATAHTLSDCMETTIFNLARGTGLEGVGGISAKRDYIIRPLIAVTRSEVEEYITENNLSYVTDSSNLSTEYSRNMLRHEVIPKLYNINSAADKAFARLYEQVRQNQSFIEKITLNALKNITTTKGYSIEKFSELDEYIKTTLIAHLLRERNISAYNDRIFDILAIISIGGRIQLNKEYFFDAQKNHFNIITEEKLLSYFSTTIGEIMCNNGEYELTNGKKYKFCILSCEQVENFAINKNLDLKNLLSYDKIDSSMIIRQKVDGDIIKLNKSSCSKKLKKLFNEHKIPIKDRKERLVLSTGEEVLWVEGIGYSEILSKNENTKKFLAIIVEGTK